METVTKDQERPEWEWCRQIFDKLDCEAPPSLADYADLENGPRWVRRVCAELIQQASPALNLRKFSGPNPRNVGLLLGQRCGMLYALGEMLEAGAGKQAEGEALLKKLRESATPMAQLAVEQVEVVGNALDELSSGPFDEFESVVHQAFKAALDQPSRQDAADFFAGFAKGLANPGVKKAKLAKDTTATPIYQRLLACWREVDQLGSVTELRQFLLARGFDEQRLGYPKRLEKICERIGLKFRKRGRPRKSDTASL